MSDIRKIAKNILGCVNKNPNTLAYPPLAWSHEVAQALISALDKLEEAEKENEIIRMENEVLRERIRALYE